MGSVKPCAMGGIGEVHAMGGIGEAGARGDVGEASAMDGIGEAHAIGDIRKARAMGGIREARVRGDIGRQQGIPSATGRRPNAKKGRPRGRLWRPCKTFRQATPVARMPSTPFAPASFTGYGWSVWRWGEGERGESMRPRESEGSRRRRLRG